MNQQEPISLPEDSLELEIDTMESVEDFIKELEAKEKDLHITADLTIEVEESEFDPRKLPDGLPDAMATDPSPEVPTVGPKTRIYELEQEVDRLNERLASLRADRNDIQEKSDRRLKDFENYRYRMDRERRGAFIDQICNLAVQMLPVLDNFDRALEAADRLNGQKSPEFQHFYDGIVLVHQQINEVISGMGVEPIKSIGERFDPNFHEAVSAVDRDDLPGNTVIDEMLRGYRIGNRVIRHSMVRVTSAPGLPKDRPADAPHVAETPRAIEPASDSSSDVLAVD